MIMLIMMMIMTKMVVVVVGVQTLTQLVVQPFNLHKILVSQISHSMGLLVDKVELITLVQKVAEAVVVLAVLVELLVQLVMVMVVLEVLVEQMISQEQT